MWHLDKSKRQLTIFIDILTIKIDIICELKMSKSLSKINLKNGHFFIMKKSTIPMLLNKIDDMFYSLG